MTRPRRARGCVFCSSTSSSRARWLTRCAGFVRQATTGPRYRTRLRSS
jgi:hypothetical protein